MALESVIKIEADPADLARLYRRLNGAGARTRSIVSQTLNDVGRKTLTEAKRAIAANLGIKQADLTRPHRFGAVGSQSTGQALRMKPSTPETLAAEVLVTGKRIPVVYFGPQQVFKKTTGEKSAGKQYRTGSGKVPKRKRGSKPAGVAWKIGIARRTYEPEAFFGRGKKGTAKSAAEAASGHVGVFRRRGKRRLPIKELRGPSIPRVAKKDPTLRRALTVDLRDYMRRRVQNALSRIAAGGQ